MVNIQVPEPSNLRLNAFTFNLDLITSNPETRPPGTGDPPFYTTFQNPRLATKEPSVTLETA